MRTFHPLGTWFFFKPLFFLLQYPHVHIYVERVSCSSCNPEVGQIIVTEFSLFISPDQTNLALGHGSNAALTAHYFASMSLNLITAPTRSPVFVCVQVFLWPPTDRMKVRDRNVKLFCFAKPRSLFARSDGAPVAD